MKLQLIFIQLVLLISFGTSQVPKLSSVTAPYGIGVRLSCLTPSSIKISIKCYSAEEFKDGSIYLLLSADSGATPERIVLWTGNSSSDTFQRSFVHNFNSKGRKSAIKAVFCFYDRGAPLKTFVEEPYFILHLPDTLLTDRNSYAGLEDAEIRYDLEKGGYEKLTDEQLRVVNPPLWRKLIKSRGGGDRN